jgi:hypothetical protein
MNSLQPDRRSENNPSYHVFFRMGLELHWILFIWQF